MVRASGPFAYDAIPAVNLRTEIVRLKVERVNKHIADLQADIQDFFATNPYFIIGERHPNTRQPVYKLGVCSEPPDRFSLITGDALQSLRSALDHMVWQLVEAAGNTPTSATAFPTGNSSQVAVLRICPPRSEAFCLPSGEDCRLGSALS